jgi:DNA primase
MREVDVLHSFELQFEVQLKALNVHPKANEEAKEKKPDETSAARLDPASPIRIPQLVAGTIDVLLTSIWHKQGKSTVVLLS